MAQTFTLNGEQVELQPIYDNPLSVGGVLVFDLISGDRLKQLIEAKHSLALFPQPSFFFVSAQTDFSIYLYPLGRENDIIEIRCNNRLDYLFKLEEWAKWKTRRDREKIARKEAKINQLTAQLEMLKDILKAQGFRVITAEKAAELGL